MQSFAVRQPVVGLSSRRGQLSSRPLRRVVTRSNGNGAAPAVCELKEGTRVKVAAPVTVYHVGKLGKAGLNLEGLEGVVKSNEADYKGLTLSANLPWKVQFMVPAPDGGKEIKVLAHLAEEELQVLD